MKDRCLIPVKSMDSLHHHLQRDSGAYPPIKSVGWGIDSCCLKDCNAWSSASKSSICRNDTGRLTLIQNTNVRKLEWR